MGTKQSVGMSVALFRVRAQRLFFRWGASWLRTQCPHLAQNDRDAHDSAMLLATVVQTTYWQHLKRNPTVTEWVHDFIELAKIGLAYYDEQPLSDTPVRAERLNVLRPWWALYHLADCNEHRALHTWSVDVGTQFLRQSGSSVVLDPTLDWTLPAHIDAAFKSATLQSWFSAIWQRCRRLYTN